MTGLARDDHGFGDGPKSERLFKVLTQFLAAGLVIGPILFGIWFASTAIEEIKPLEPLPPPNIAPLPKLPVESEALPRGGVEPASFDLAAGPRAAAQ